ncbi:acyl transferase/acyl hydrolase/lysophospholipase [Paraphysoderma sedebokerense]|nr:acyl transferase/acyl hydrolase/lysophospholipase [Paraphysoderma sedebokerense]
MLHGLIQKTFFGQPIALADFFGTVLFSKFFRYDNTTEWSEMFKYYMTLSDQQTVLSPSKFPFPLYTAVHHDLPTDTYPWLTFTPSHIHISHYDQTDPHLISSLPVWGLGRDFESGNSVDSRPEVPLGILMGVFGSAFSASVNRIWDEVKEMFPKQLLDKVGDMIERDPKLAEFHVIPPAVFPNPMYNLREQQTTTSDINSANNPVKPASTDSKDATPEVFKLKDLTVMDAGIDFNFPLPPLTHPQRESDIILLFDASEDIATNINTDRANEFMKRWGIPFPTLQKSDVLKSPVTVFPPPKGTDGPTVIYFPLVNLKYGDETVDLVDLKRDKMRKEDISFVNEMLVERFNPVTEDCCKTTNFVWTANQIMAMTELVRCNVLDSRDQIKNVIQAVYDSKKAKIG